MVLLISRHENVSLHAPPFAPGILHDVELCTLRIASKADGENSVIQLFTTALVLVVDSLVVELETPVGSIDGDGDWALLPEGVSQGGLVSMIDINERTLSCSLVPRVVTAFPLARIVGIAFLRVKALVLDDILESIVHHATIASVVAKLGGTIHEVLLGEIDQFSIFDEVGSFE